MISFKQFLTFESAENYGAAITNTAIAIKRDCQPFLEIAKGKQFYRGLNIYEGESDVVVPSACYKLTVRKDRQPKDSPGWLHKALNDELRDLTGRNVRSECLFASGDYEVATRYGDAYAVYPIGNVDYVWSKQTADPAYELYMGLYSDGSQDMQTSVGKKLAKEFMQHLKRVDPEAHKEAGGSIDEWRRYLRDDDEIFNSADTVWSNFITDFIKRNNFWIYNEGLTSATSSKYKEHEVMFLCNSFYAVPLQISVGVQKELKKNAG